MKSKMFPLMRYLPVLAWMSLIFFLSSRSTAGIGHNTLDRFLILKTFHLIEYAVLVGLLLFARIKPKTSLLISYLYAVSDEIHQVFVPGRTGKFSDTLIDLLGISIGLLLYRQLKKFWPKIL